MNIEELAFKDRKILANLNEVDLLNIIEFLQDDRRQCLDEEEHNKLKEEITNLSKDVDMWNAKYNDMFDENRMLKKQVEEWEHHLKCSREMLDIQGQKGNYDYDEYMLGLYNGMEYIIALFETREPNFISGKDVEFTNNKTQQKKFIKWLEDYLNLFDNMDIDEQISYDTIEEILQKYRSIIGGNDNE